MHYSPGHKKNVAVIEGCRRCKQVAVSGGSTELSSALLFCHLFTCRFIIFFYKMQVSFLFPLICYR